MTESNLAIVRRFGTALRESDFDEMGRLLHDDFVVHAAGGLPYSGDYRGLSGFRDLLNTMNAAMTLTPGLITREQLGESAVASRFSLTFTARASAISVTMTLIEVYTLRNQKIIELDVYYKNPAAVTALSIVPTGDTADHRTVVVGLTSAEKSTTDFTVRVNGADDFESTVDVALKQAGRWQRTLTIPSGDVTVELYRAGESEPYRSAFLEEAS